MMGTGIRTFAILLMLVLVIIAALAVGRSGGKPLEIIVDDDWVGADYDNIQDAINNTTSGNWIYVHAGVYDENVVINKSFRFIGNGTNETIVDGGYSGSAMAVNVSDVRIEGFGLTGSYWLQGILDVRDCSNLQVSNCSMNKTYGSDSFGIYLFEVNESTIDNCFVYRTHNVQLDTIDNVTFTDCVFDNQAEVGIQLEEATGCFFFNCTVNRTMGTGVGGTDSDWNVFEQCDLIDNVYGGISVLSCDNNTFIDCNISGNGRKYDMFEGVYMEFSDSNTFENCTIYDHPYEGVYISNSHYNTFINTSVYENDRDGLSFDNSNYNTIVGCNVYNNTYNGTLLDLCNWTEIHNSTFHHNDIYGIGMNFSENSTITYNEIFWNTNYGVYVGWGCWNNVIHHNNFLKNHNSPQAADETGNNEWTDGVEGNWWDNWNGTGAYPLDGAANATDDAPADDPYPTSAPEKVPELTLMMSVAAMFLVAAAIRRRRK